LFIRYFGYYDDFPKSIKGTLIRTGKKYREKHIILKRKRGNCNYEKAGS